MNLTRQLSIILTVFVIIVVFHLFFVAYQGVEMKKTEASIKNSETQIKKTVEKLKEGFAPPPPISTPLAPEEEPRPKVETLLPTPPVADGKYIQKRQEIMPYIPGDIDVCEAPAKVEDDPDERLRKTVRSLRESDNKFLGQTLQEVFDRATAPPKEYKKECVLKGKADTNMGYSYFSPEDDERTHKRDFWIYREEEVGNGGKFGSVYPNDPWAEHFPRTETW